MVDIKLTDDIIFEDDEHFNVEITGGDIDVGYNLTTITIIDDDRK